MAYYVIKVLLYNKTYCQVGIPQKKSKFTVFVRTQKYIALGASKKVFLFYKKVC